MPHIWRCPQPACVTRSLMQLLLHGSYMSSQKFLLVSLCLGGPSHAAGAAVAASLTGSSCLDTHEAASNACLLTAQPLHGMAPKELAILCSRIANLRWLQPQVINVPLLCCSHHPTAEVCADICTVGVSQMILLSNWQRVWAKSVCCPFEQLLFIHGAPVTARQ